MGPISDALGFPVSATGPPRTSLSTIGRQSACRGGLSDSFDGLQTVFCLGILAVLAAWFLFGTVRPHALAGLGTFPGMVVITVIILGLCTVDYLVWRFSRLSLSDVLRYFATNPRDTRARDNIRRRGAGQEAACRRQLREDHRCWPRRPGRARSLELRGFSRCHQESDSFLVPCPVLVTPGGTFDGLSSERKERNLATQTKEAVPDLKSALRL